jgi:caffeoyl-CoA O-methyltransferase
VIVTPEIERYVAEHATPAPPALERLAEETRATLRMPQMLTGLVEGRFLEMLVWMGRPRLVLELGTYSGYSALSMAAALPDGGRIVTCEVDPEHAEFAERHIAASPHADRIEVRLGPALETIAGLEGPFDLVFIDADKESYAAYYEAVLGKLAPRGLIAVDNTLRDGSVADPAADDERTQNMRDFNDLVRGDERVVSVILTVRDGVTLIRRAEAGA